MKNCFILKSAPKDKFPMKNKPTTTAGTDEESRISLFYAGIWIGLAYAGSGRNSSHAKPLVTLLATGRYYSLLFMHLAHLALHSIRFSNYWSTSCHIVKGNIRVSVSFHYFGIDWLVFSSFGLAIIVYWSMSWPTRPLYRLVSHHIFRFASYVVWLCIRFTQWNNSIFLCTKWHLYYTGWYFMQIATYLVLCHY
jgi:hypothetical protein